LFFCKSICAEGFVAGTLVKTNDGFVPIEQLHSNDEIICFDLVNSCILQPIAAITTEIIDSYVDIEVSSIHIYLACNQLLYEATDKTWVQASQLTIHNILLTYDLQQQIPITAISIVDQPIELYKISVSNIHTFLVSPLGIIAHNFFPLIALGIGFAFGAGAVECTLGLTAGIGVLGSVIGFAASKQIGKRTKSNITPTINSIGSCTPGGPPQDPKKRKTDKAANMYDVFENHPVGKILKNCAKKTKNYVQGQTIWQATKDMIEYGIKESDYFYLDNLHKDHIEVFKSTGKMLLRTILNLDGSINLEKIARAGMRSVRPFIK
jgi:hypothetical protein